MVLVTLPLPQRFLELLPNGQADIEQTEALIRALASATSSHHVDLSDGYANSDFVDFTHLGAAAAIQMTGRLAEQLRPQPLPDPKPHREEERIVAAVDVAQRAIEMNDIVYHHLSGKGAYVSSEFWYNFVHYGHVQNLTAQSLAGETTDTLIVGSSLAYYDINTNVYTRRTGRSAYNVGMSQAGPELNQHWLLDTAIPLSRPNRIIWTTSPRSFRETPSGGCTRSTLDYDEPVALQEEVFADVPWLAGVERAELFVQEPSVAGPVLDVPIWEQFTRTFSEFGHRIRRYEPAPEELALQAEELAGHLDRQLVCEARLDVWTDTIRELSGQGIEIIVVWMPLPDKRVEIYPGSREILAQIALVIEDAALAAGATFLDLSASPGDEFYIDYNHLNGAGAKKFTRELVRALESKGL